MNRFSHVDFAAPLSPLRGGTLMPVTAGARCAPPSFPPLSPPLRGGAGGAIASCAPPSLSPPCGGAGGAGGAQRVVAPRGVFGHEGQGGSAAPEPVEATKARSSSLTSLG